MFFQIKDNFNNFVNKKQLEKEGDLKFKWK